jgi:hypothetical protein
MIELTREESKSLVPILERLSTRASRVVGVEQLLRQWETFVKEVENGYVLTGYDYVNDLATRDFLDELTSTALPSVREKLMRSGLDASDARFRAASRELTKPLRIGTPERPRWWWFRVPNDVSGELAKDLIAN